MTRFSKLLLFTMLLMLFSGCKDSEKNLIPSSVSEKQEEQKEQQKRNLSEEFKEYWYTGTAEITSYHLTQERYGELREGIATTIFVTEDFLPEIQVKANSSSTSNIPVLKLNTTKKFVTGIYPYSIMTSTFNPLTTEKHALKISHSVQEWCGQVYMQLNSKEDFELISHSYFEGEADQNIKISKTWLEDELWNIIRINPEELPTGEITAIPSFEYLRLRHKETKAYPAFAKLKQGDSITSYSLNYPELQRELVLYFNSKFPYEIEKWEETNATNPKDSLRLKTIGSKMKRMRTAYWTQNKNKDVILRDSLNLK